MLAMRDIVRDDFIAINEIDAIVGIAARRLGEPRVLALSSSPMNRSAFTPGAVFRLGPRRVLESEVLEFGRRFDPQPFHTDPELAARTRWGGVIASGWHTCSMAMEMVAHGLLDGSGGQGSPGVDELRWERPVRPGDELSLVVTVLDSAPSSSGRHHVVSWRWEMFNQHGDRVLHLRAATLFPPA
jgi:acyl dehydratase